MKTLVIGKGGREHAIVRALRLSPSVSEIHSIPGNSGIAKEAICHNIDTASSREIIDFVKQKNIELVVIGPEVELANGLADELRAAGANVFGPGQNAARLESSKIFAKEFMQRAGVPTALSTVVKSVDDIKNSVGDFTPPYVLKADGLAAGKGVFICDTLDELYEAGSKIFDERVLGNSGLTALLEQNLQGWELSYLCITNGNSYESLPLAQDHKRLLENDEGPNTGGMGVVCPLSIDEDLNKVIQDEILNPTVKTIESMGLMYRGVIYVGLMITKDGPKVLEYNVRFGDPEAQVIMPLLDGDWGQVLMAVARGDVPSLEWKPLYSSCVVLAAEGYPESPKKNVVIEGGIEDETPSSYFLHAGTEKNQQGDWVTAGGRVLNALGVGSTLSESLKNAYSQAEKVSWPNMQMRKDIGKKVLQP